MGHCIDSAGWEQPVLLKDGTRLTLALLAADQAMDQHEALRRRIAEGYERLSPRSRRLRFISPPDHLASWQLDYLSDLDPCRGRIWIARKDGDPEPEGVGLARCMRVSGQEGVCEVALTVIDVYQNRGLGRIFLRHMLVYARDSGIALLRGYTLAENTPMLHLFESFDADRPVDENGLLRVDLPVPRCAGGLAV